MTKRDTGFLVALSIACMLAGMLVGVLAGMFTEQKFKFVHGMKMRSAHGPLPMKQFVVAFSPFWNVTNKRDVGSERELCQYQTISSGTGLSDHVVAIINKQSVDDTEWKKIKPTIEVFDLPFSQSKDAEKIMEVGSPFYCYKKKQQLMAIAATIGQLVRPESLKTVHPDSEIRFFRTDEPNGVLDIKISDLVDEKEDTKRNELVSELVKLVFKGTSQQIDGFAGRVPLYYGLSHFISSSELYKTPSLAHGEQMDLKWIYVGGDVAEPAPVCMDGKARTSGRLMSQGVVCEKVETFLAMSCEPTETYTNNSAWDIERFARPKENDASEIMYRLTRQYGLTPEPGNNVTVESIDFVQINRWEVTESGFDCHEKLTNSQWDNVDRLKNIQRFLDALAQNWTNSNISEPLKYVNGEAESPLNGPVVQFHYLPGLQNNVYDTLWINKKT